MVNEVLKIDEFDENLLHFGDIKVEKYSGLLGASRHITYHINQRLAIKIDGVEARWWGPNHLRIDESSSKFKQFQRELKNCIDTVDIKELRSHCPDQGLINEIVGESMYFEADDPNNPYDYPFFEPDPEALRFFNLKDVVGSDCITSWFYGGGCIPPSTIFINQYCVPSVRKDGDFTCDLTIKLDSIFMTTEPEVSLMGSIINIEKIA